MYSGNKYLVQKVIKCRTFYNKLSDGLPHSEIRGSKPILGSPQLIAEYHVLHRLLLPRHPPNALLALDLIQKKQGYGYNLMNIGWHVDALIFWSKVILSRPLHVGEADNAQSLDCAG